MAYVNTRFDDSPGIYAESVEAGLFPELTPPDPSLIWLSNRSPTQGVIMLMSNQPPHAVSLLPLPISLPDLFEAKNGRQAAGFEDERFRQWTVWELGTNDPPPFSDTELSLLKSDFEHFKRSFIMALRVDGDFHRNSARYRAELPNRQAAVADLNLTIANL